MKVERIPQTPPPPPDLVLITLSMEEARQLMALCAGDPSNLLRVLYVELCNRGI
jgi:hypothetical protein